MFNLPSSTYRLSYQVKGLNPQWGIKKFEKIIVMWYFIWGKVIAQIHFKLKWLLGKGLSIEPSISPILDVVMILSKKSPKPAKKYFCNSIIWGKVRFIGSVSDFGKSLELWFYHWSNSRGDSQKVKGLNPQQGI
jgi:hypothetical protein